MIEESWRRWVVPLGDFVIAGVLFILTLPLMGIIALAIKLDSPGPLFYHQECIGLSGFRYYALKFRTVARDNERGGGLRGAQREVRLTRVGRFLWRTRLENLPQLINVLNGQMSVVGTSPQRPYFLS
jgi:lipopolysaccharide/colanic/teichoic acid biosynthesis glycosyltransferase